MASVFLRFTPPDHENLSKLLIFEAADSDGPFITPIETVTAIGNYPDYISEYTTDVAASPTDWFAIQWEDAKGARTELSNPIQGGEASFVGEIISLVGERDPNLDDQVVRQETEVAVEMYFGQDPYTVDGSNVTYTVKVGLARLVQARAMINDLATASTGGAGSSSGWVAGLVSMKSGTEQAKQSEALIKYLLQSAMTTLGLNIGRIAQMAVPCIAGGFSQIVSADISRLLIEVE